MRLELLPRKEFEIHLDSGEVIKGKFNTWAVKRFCDKKKISLSQLDNLINIDSITIDHVCDLILCSVEYIVRREKKPFGYSDLDVCDWIDEMGGLMSLNYQSLINHFGSEEKDEEKKSPTENSNGGTLKESLEVQV